MNNYITAVAVVGSPSLYAGGHFTTAGLKTSNYIGRWTMSQHP